MNLDHLTLEELEAAAGSVSAVLKVLQPSHTPLDELTRENARRDLRALRREIKNRKVSA